MPLPLFSRDTHEPPRVKPSLRDALDIIVDSLLGIVDTATVNHSHLLQFELKLDSVESSLHALMSELRASARAFEERSDKDQKNVAVLPKIDASLKSIEDRIRSLEQNLDQVRLQTEAIARTLDGLTTEFIERQVKEPLQIELLRIFDLLSRAKANGGSECTREVLDRIADVFDTAGLRIIKPASGDPFNPRFHLPLERRVTEEGALVGRIAESFFAGLADSSHLIAPAKVAVFITAEANCRKSLEGGQEV